MPDKVTQQPYNMFSLQKSTPMSTFAERHMPILQGGQKVDYAQQQLQQNIQNAMQQPQQVVEQPVQTPVAQRPQPVVNPNDPNSGMEALLYTSPEQEEKMRRASVQRQRIMAIGDALRHIGNVVNTVNYAPSQQFNSPAENERKRYLGEKAIRDANNYKYMSYQQAKAAQEQKMKQWEQQFKLNQANAAAQAAYRQEQARIAAANAASQDAYRRGNLARQEAADKARNDYNERKLKQQISHQNRMAGIAGMNAQNNKRRTDAYVERMKNGGKNNTISLRGKNGWYRKQMNNAEATAFYNQTYDEMKKRGLINEGNVLAGLPANPFGQKSLSLAAKKAAVDNALMQHGDVGDWLSDEYEFEFDPRGPQAPQQQQQQQNIYFGSWNSNLNQGSGVDDDEEDIFGDDFDGSFINI